VTANTYSHVLADEMEIDEHDASDGVASSAKELRWLGLSDVPPDFDFAAYAAAIERKDAAAWSEFFDADVRWIEYRERNPPRAPNVMEGIAQVRSFLEGVSAAPLELRVSHEVVGTDRAAYRLTVELDDGREIIEHIIIELVGSRIVCEVDVEAWD
jgi:SnoaL-like domain